MIILAVAILILVNLLWQLLTFQPFREIPLNQLKKQQIPPSNHIDTLKVRSHILIIQRFINYKRFFNFLDSISEVHLGKGVPISYDLLIIWFNRKVLNNLKSTDYNNSLASGKWVYDLNQEVILKPGDTLVIPDPISADSAAKALLSTRLVLNIPEFRLRLIRGRDTLLTCPVRVGRNEESFLEAVGQTVDLRTPIGEGYIRRVWRTPKSINLHTGEEYITTKRDDGRVTKMPAIPSLEPVLNGRRTGKMIHATTNPITLGSAYSHGCVGVSEADMWTIYYNMPVGAKVEFRYDLKVGNQAFKDVYNRGY